MKPDRTRSADDDENKIWPATGGRVKGVLKIDDGDGVATPRATSAQNRLAVGRVHVLRLVPR